MMIIVCTVTILLMTPVLFLGLETVAAWLNQRRLSLNIVEQGESPVNFTVLIPAHDEELEIAKTLEDLIGQVSSPDQVLVVADNCLDQTAKIAREYGVTVVERFDEQQRGKGYALAYGVEYLQDTSRPDVLIVLDADCRVAKGQLRTLAVLAQKNGEPVQACYLLTTERPNSLLSGIADFAVLYKNYIRPLGLNYFGFPCLLYGTGMAFPWRLVEQLSFATGNIVEDMELGISCVRLGSPPCYCERVLVQSKFPNSLRAEKTQRTRWEHGHLRTMCFDVPRLLLSAIVKKDCNLFLLALEIGVPPLSLLVLLQGIVGGVIVAIGVFLESLYLLVLGILPILTFVLVVLIGWLIFGKEVLPLKSLVLIPCYILKKIPVYLNFLYKAENKWIRTSRK